ncbi:Uncharacterized protein SCF082_LOCUS11964 [Durusdinium trenchii]|uniref:Leucine-rich repeat-containing protein 71 n=1 Tax=Durusdinium trenchii TaxID=1381693 RepID=A0ABP0JGH4_9DINO
MFSGNPHEVPVKQALLRTQLPTARSGSAQSAQRTLRCHKELEDDRVTELGLHRKELQTCETVDLAENKFTHEALRYILPYCLQFSGLEILKLYKNDIGDEGAELLADFCEGSSSLRELHLSHNRIRAHGAVVIVHAAERSRTSSTRTPLWLRLERNAVEHPADIADALQQKLSVCLRLDRRQCNSQHCAKNCKVHLPYFLLQSGAGDGVEEVRKQKEMETGVYEETTKRPRLEPSTFSELVEFGESCEHDDWIGSPPMPPMPSPEKMCSGLSSSDFTLDLEDLPPAKAPPKPSAVGSTGRRSNRKHPELKARVHEFPPKPPVETQGSDLPGALPGAEALQAPNVASRCQLIPRKDVQMGVKLKHSQSQAREAMMAKVDELRAWQEYLEARKRFINLCDEWPDHEPEEDIAEESVPGPGPGRQRAVLLIDT